MTVKVLILLRRSFSFILYGRNAYVYGSSIGWAALPIIFSFVLHLDREIQLKAGVFNGYCTKSNWSSFIVILPVAIWLLRRTLRVLSPRNDEGPIVKLFPSEGQRSFVRTELAENLESGYNLLCACCLMTIAHIIDMWQVFSLYLNGCRRIDLGSIEKDWSVFFLIGTSCFPGESIISIKANFAFVALAYSVQFITGTIAALVLIVFARHNLFFLAHIFQKRHAQLGRATVVIDLNDDNELFGFKSAIPAFNFQVLVTAVAGVLILWSRFKHFSDEAVKWIYDSHFSIFEPTKLLQNIFDAFILSSASFSDGGQLLLIILWLAMLVIVSIPAMIKFLPMFSAKGHNLTLTEFLNEFIPDTKWAAYKDVNTMADLFSCNAFWPTGDGRARVYFMSAFFVFLEIVIPIRHLDGYFLVELKLFVVFLVASYLATSAALWSFKFALRIISDKLVGKAKDNK